MNSVTTLKNENINKKVNKTIATTEEHKMIKGKKVIKIVKIQAEAEVLLKKEQITKGLLNQRNKEINTATRK